MTTAKTIIALALLLLITACTNGTRLPDTLEERVQLRWDALTSGDVNTAYRLLSPGYREAVDQNTYVSRLRARTVFWTGTQLVEIASCEGEVCIAMVDIGYKVNKPLPGVQEYESTRRTQERWIRTDGAWYFVPERLQ